MAALNPAAAFAIVAAVGSARPNLTVAVVPTLLFVTSRVAIYKALAGIVPIKEVPNPLYNARKPSPLITENAVLMQETWH
ncbi:hypothetical protein Lal_00003218 [Lupinus albus]|nr:hypothetical protein Lal_00003218 [Lupinus albus]